MIEAFVIGWFGIAMFVFARYKLSKNPTYRPFQTLKMIGMTIAFLGLIKIFLKVFNVV